MFRHPHNRDLFLISRSDVLADLDPAELAPEHRSAVRELFDWARTYLMQAHPDLGRSGPVCPFVAGSLRHDSFLVTVQPGAHPDRDRVADAVLTYGDWFLELPPRDGPAAQFKTILIAFPDVPTVDAPAIIDTTQAQLKPGFVSRGLMLGQFHPLPPPEGGLWNPSFRPLRSPVPLLAIRHMVPSDLPFLTSERQFVDAYVQVFGDRLNPSQRLQVADGYAKLDGAVATWPSAPDADLHELVAPGQAVHDLACAS